MKSIAIKTTLALVCSLLFATQANAYDITTNVSPTGKSWEWGNAGWLQTMQISGTEYNLSSTGSAIFWGRGFSQSGLNVHWILKSVVSGNNIEFIEGNYYKTQISWNVVGFNTGNQDPYGIQIPIVNRLVLPSNSPYKLVSITPQTVQCYEASNFYSSTSTGALLGGSTGCYRGNVVYDIIVQATRTATGKLQLGDGAQWMFQSYVGFNNPTGYGTLTPLTITEYKPESVSTVNQEQQQAGEQAQQDGQNASNQSQTEATNQGTSLINGASNIIGALTDTTAGTCNINMNMGLIDLGTQNFCQGDIGPIRPIIATITNILFAFVSLKVFMFLIGVMFGLFDQFLGTKTERGE